jgi:hypothetical protein
MKDDSKNVFNIPSLHVKSFSVFDFENFVKILKIVEIIINNIFLRQRGSNNILPIISNFL